MRMTSRLVSLLGSAPFKKPGPSVDFEKVKWGRYLKKILILNSFSIEETDPRFTRLKSGLELRLFSKRLFYKRAKYFRNIFLSQIRGKFKNSFKIPREINGRNTKILIMRQQ